MAKSTSTGTRTRKSAKAVEAAAQQQFDANDMDLGEQPLPFSAEDVGDLADLTDEEAAAENDDDDDDDAVASSDPTVDEGAAVAPINNYGKYQWLMRVNAHKVLVTAVRKLGSQRAAFEELGVAGIPAALQILGKAVEAMDALAKKGKAGRKNVVAGTVAKIRAKVSADYVDVLTEEEMGALTVKRVVGRNAHCALEGGKIAVLPLGHLEVA